MKRGIAKKFATISCRAYNHKANRYAQAPRILATTLKIEGAVEMSNERASDLARHCTELVRKGNDFTTVWSTAQGHTLVEGIPRKI